MAKAAALSPAVLARLRAALERHRAALERHRAALERRWPRAVRDLSRAAVPQAAEAPATRFSSTVR
jgi:hypothetical protein